MDLKVTWQFGSLVVTKVPHQCTMLTVGELDAGYTGTLCIIFATFLLIHNYSKIKSLFKYLVKSLTFSCDFFSRQPVAMR